MQNATMELSKQPLRMLKKMRRYHRKLRSSSLHKESLQTLKRIISIKQDTYFLKQAKEADTRFQRLLRAIKSKMQ